MRLDHVSYVAAADELVDVVQSLGAELGAPFQDGGRHPRFGTRNFVLPLAGDAYLEVVTTLEHPSVDRAPFHQAVRRRADLGGGWLGWVVAVDDLAPVESRLGRPAVDGNRQRPDGFDLRWRQIGVLDLIADPQLPFFVQWLVEADEHPSAGAHPDVRISRLEIAGDPKRVYTWLGEPENHPLDGVDVVWVTGEPGLVAVVFSTPKGDVRVE
jgi:hypothetical protein